MNAIDSRGQENGVFRLLPLVLALVFPFVVQLRPAWLQMWATAGGIWFGCKCALSLGSAAWQQTGWKRRVAWWLWAGMDFKTFAGPKLVTRVLLAEWFQAGGCTLLGVLLFLRAAPRFALANELVAGWVAWTGIVLFLHFGVFHFVALFLRRNGVAVRPLMVNPAAAITVSEFWGRRWNHAFQEVAHRLLFAPIIRMAGARWGILGVFLASGLVHELVITLPAGGGHGLPTLYFVIQGGALLVQKSDWARRQGLGVGWKARAFTLTVVAVPVVALFPPQFFRAVIVPLVSDVASLVS